MAGHLVAPEWALPELLRALRQIFPVAAVVLALLQGLTSEGRQADRRLFCGDLNCKVFARSSCRARKALLFHSFPVHLPEESAKLVPNGALTRLTPVHHRGRRWRWRERRPMRRGHGLHEAEGPAGCCCNAISV